MLYMKFIQKNKTIKIMKVQQIYEINYTIIDRGVEFKAKPIETNDKDHNRAVRKHLNKWSYSMDLSKNYKFTINDVSCVGYGTI